MEGVFCRLEASKKLEKVCFVKRIRETLLYNIGIFANILGHFLLDTFTKKCEIEKIKLTHYINIQNSGYPLFILQPDIALENI